MPGGSSHLLQTGQQADQPAAAEHERNGQQQRAPDRPAQGAQEDHAEPAPAVLANGLTHQSFGSIGETVQGIGNHQQKGDQHGVGGQDDIALPGTLSGEKRQYQQQGNGANHDVTVHPQNGQVVCQLPEQRAGQSLAFRHPPEHDGKPDQGGAVFGHHGSHGHAPAVPAQYRDEEHVQRNVDTVGDDQHHHGAAGELGADQPAHQGVLAQHRRCAPDADGRVFCRQSGHLGAGIHQLQTNPDQRLVEQDQ